MNIRKKAIKYWPDSECKLFLNSYIPDKTIKWLLCGESLYSHMTSDDKQMIIMDDDDIRGRGICEFLKRNGGFYVSNNEAK